MANLRMIIDSVEIDDVFDERIANEPATDHNNILNFFEYYMKVLRSGHLPGSVIRVSHSEVKASGTAQCTSVIADDEFTVGAKTLVCKVSPANQNQFELGDNDNETAANLAECINANTDLNTWLKASVLTDTVTVECIVPGIQGNNIPLSADSTITVSGAFLEDGEDGTNSVDVM